MATWERLGSEIQELRKMRARPRGRGVCEGCGHLRRHIDLQCASCRVTTLTRETRDWDVFTAASSGGHNGEAGEVSDLLENVAGAREGVRGDRGGQCWASVDGVSWRWRWVVNDGERALLFRKILWDAARPWGLLRWCKCLPGS